MISITYWQLVILISALWIIARVICSLKNKKFDPKREAQLLLVYICIVVVIRFTFFPFSKVEGVIQPLVIDTSQIFPPSINLRPFAHTLGYPTKGEIVLNFAGNIAMFIPLGIVWPCVFKNLNTHLKVLGAGVLSSLSIELLQLPAFDRVTDIDDLILNSIGFAIGYVIYLSAKAIIAKIIDRNRFTS